MTATWNNLASSARWSRVVSFIRNWVGPFDSSQGMPADELDLVLRKKGLHLPTAVHEWYLLSANSPQSGLIVWMKPQELTANHDGIVWVLTDTDGVNSWGIRTADLEAEDPPVITEDTVVASACSSFSEFVAAMIVNAVLFDYETEEPIELKHDSIHAESMHHFASYFGDFFADGPLGSATIVMFAYPGDRGVFGKSRTSAGRARLKGCDKKQRELFSAASISR